MGAGAYACFGVSVGNGVSVGRHVHIGVGAVLGHDASVGDFTLIAPRAVVSGCVRIAKSAYIGAGSSVKQKVTVGEGALVGLGAVVVRDVAEATTVVGNPRAPASATSPDAIARREPLRSLQARSLPCSHPHTIDPTSRAPTVPGYSRPVRARADRGNTPPRCAARP